MPKRKVDLDDGDSTVAATRANEPLHVVLRPLEDLIPYARNPRTHSEEQIAQIAASMEEFGWTNPILADEKGIVAGHGRVLAARRLIAAGRALRAPSGQELPAGMVPVIDCTGWTAAQRRAYVIADNQLALNAGWDMDLLRLEVGELVIEGFELSILGFDADALKDLLDTPAEAQERAKASLAERFGVPPFSVLNAREGWWQDRKRAWIALGIQSELGRGGGAGEPNAIPGGAPMPLDRKRDAERASPGGSRMPAANYSVSGARGDGRGRPVS